MNRFTLFSVLSLTTLFSVPAKAGEASERLAKAEASVKEATRHHAEAIRLDGEQELQEIDRRTAKRRLDREIGPALENAKSRERAAERDLKYLDDRKTGRVTREGIITSAEKFLEKARTNPHLRFTFNNDEGNFLVDQLTPEQVRRLLAEKKREAEELHRDLDTARSNRSAAEADMKAAETARGDAERMKREAAKDAEAARAQEKEERRKAAESARNAKELAEAEGDTATAAEADRVLEEIAFLDEADRILEETADTLPRPENAPFKPTSPDYQEALDRMKETAQGPAGLARVADAKETLKTEIERALAAGDYDRAAALKREFKELLAREGQERASLGPAGEARRDLAEKYLDLFYDAQRRIRFGQNHPLPPDMEDRENERIDRDIDPLYDIEDALEEK